jgi:hypothetical protein
MAFEKQVKKTDCDVVIDNIENVFDSLGNCLESAIDDKKTKMNVMSSIFGLGKSLTKFAFHTTTCLVKNTPKAVVAVAAVKREIVTGIEEEYRDYQKQIKEDALDEKIKQLSLKV